MNGKSAIGLVLLALAAWLAFEAWQHVEPGLSEGWLSWGVAGKVFMPIIVLAVLAIALWRR
jgi:hypothetical protein